MLSTDFCNMKKKLIFLVVGWMCLQTVAAQEGVYKKAFYSGESYKYNCTGKDVSAAYKLPFYEDSPFFTEDDWKNGRGALGYGVDGIKTQTCFGEDSANKVITTYIISDEMSFDYNGAEFDSLLLKVRYNDGFVAFINGVEVARRNLLPVAGNSSTASEEHTGAEFEIINITPFKSSIITQGSFFAAEVHQHAANSSDLVFDFEVIYYKGRSVVHSVTRKPYLMMGTPSSVEVRWQTSTPSPTSLTYGKDLASVNINIMDTTPVTEHKVMVSGLDPDTRYYYTINNEETFVNEVENQYFHTNPIAGAERKYRFWVLGDFGDGSPNQVQVLSNYTANNAGKFTDAWLWLGDNAYSSGTQGEYQTKVFNIYPTVFRNTMTYPSPGNHDLGSAIAASQSGAYFDNFDVPCHGEAGGVPSNTEAYYSYDYGNIHFISLESTQSSRKTEGEMARWLQKDLAANKQKWTIAYWHHPPYSKGSHNSDTEGNLIEMREYICPILEQYGVDLVMCGHSHTYERSYLLDSHYGTGATLADSMLLRGKTDGRVGGDGPYLKPNEHKYSHKGTVYFVNGTGGSLSVGEAIDHPAIYKAIEAGGSVMLEINGDTLTSTFMNATNPNDDDQFTIIKSKEEPCKISLNLGPDVTINNGENMILNAGNRFLSYLWSTGETTEKISVDQPGDYICTVGSSAGCQISDTIKVLANYDAFVNLGADTIICSGQELLLSASNVFANYWWNTGETTREITVTQSGIYSILVTAQNGTTATDSIEVIVKDIPSVAISANGFTFVENETVFVSAVGVAESYHWNFGDFSTADGQEVNHAYPIAGVYDILLEGANAQCRSYAQWQVNILKDNTAIEVHATLHETLGLLVFPNPAEESITIQFENRNLDDVDVNIFSEEGELIYAKSFIGKDRSSKNEFTVDTDNWSYGLYHLVITGGRHTARSKFIIGKK